MTRKTLEGNVHGPQQGLSRADALRAVQAWTPQVLVLDANLPDMIGYGASSKPEGLDYTLALFTDTLYEALRQHGIERGPEDPALKGGRHGRRLGP